MPVIGDNLKAFLCFFATVLRLSPQQLARALVLFVVPEFWQHIHGVVICHFSPFGLDIIGTAHREAQRGTLLNWCTVWFVFEIAQTQTLQAFSQFGGKKALTYRALCRLPSATIKLANGWRLAKAQTR